MAKDKEKVKVAGTGKKWAVWKTVLVVISSVIFVAGVTLLGIYLAGGLRNPVTPPDDIAFVVDDDLYSADNAQFEVTEDFELVITSSTEQVTERQVRLSFTGSTTTNPSTGTISDGVITVPQIVNIGEPFTVTLNMTRYQELGGQNWIAGGISTLTATSMSNDQADPTSVKIAVDVPVYDIEIELYDEGGNQISQVTELERFYPRAKFLPEKSRYRYSDDAIVAEDGVTVERRTKNVYFEGQSSDNIVFFFNDGDPYFEAGELSTENNFSIVGYTFIHADDQASTLTELETLYQGEQLYNNIIKALRDAKIGKSNSGTFEIVQASIKSFTVGRSSISVTAGMTSRIAVASSQNADASLDASIISTDDESLEGMLRNVAIRFTRVEGSGIVEANDALNVRGGEEVVIDGNTYIKVNDDVLDYNYSYLDISPMVAGTYNMEVVLLMRDGSDGYRLFEVDGEAVINSIILNVRQNTEAQLSWSNGGADITIPLQYQNGDVQPALYDLSGFGIVPEGNAYQTVVYFASFENSGGISAEDVLVSWQSGREGDYLVGADIRWLYPFQGSSFSVDGDGEFELYFATVRTINGQIQYNEDGTYQTVQFVSDPITVRVERSLHEGSVTNLTTTLNGNGFDHAGGIYVQEGSTASIDLTFAVDVNSYETFAEVFNQNMLELRVFSVGGQDISTSFTISQGTLTPGEEEDANGTLSYNLAINPSLGLGINEFLTIGKVELTDRDSGLVWSMLVVTAGEDGRQITLYSPQPVSITLASDDIDVNGQISIVQALTTDGGFTTTITQDGQSIANSIDELIGKLSVQVTDQIGQTSTLGSWIWATDNESAVTVNGKSFSFRSTNGQDPVSANIWVTYTNYSNITSEARLNLSISSTGVAAITYDNTQKLADTQPPLVDWTDGLGEVSLSKYGAQGGTITLGNIIHLYLDEGKTQQYTPKFRFNANELYRLSDNDVVALFGQTSGMIRLTLEGGESVKSDDANEIRTLLTNSYVQSLTFNHNFGTSQTLRFEIVDEGLTGAVDIDLNLQILANSTLQTAVNSVEAYAATNIGFEDFSITNNNDKNSKELKAYLKGLYEDGYRHIVQDNFSGTGNLYMLSKDSTGAVGSVNADGTITFYDFWDEETREFALRLYLDGINVTNTFAPVATINFTISRNVRVTYTGTAYQILGDNNAIGNYIKVEREVYSETPLLDASYAFASGAPLEITDGTISQSQTYFFDYNEITKTCSLTVSVGGSEIATFDNFAYTLGEGTYGSIAKEFTGTIEVEKYQAGTIQTVANEEGEEVQYLYLTTGDWKFGEDKDGVTTGVTTVFNGYNVQMKSLFPQEEVPDGVNSAYLSVNTNYTMTSEFQANFPNRTSVMTGLDNPNVYIQFEVVSNNNVVARIVMPLIVSNYGKVFGVYDSDLSNDGTLTDHTKDHRDMSLANILSDANTLIENDIYTEVYAGQSVVVARRMGLNETFDENKATGLYYLPDDAQVSARVTLITDNEGYREGLLRRVSSGSGLVDFTYDSARGEYSISLNHLESSESEVYVAVQFALRYADDEQYFTYVLKVLQTVDVEDGVYAYNTPTEYLTPDDNNQIEVDLAQKFGNTTLHNGETRFNYEFEANAQNTDDLKYSYSVESLTLDNDQVLTEESEWSRYISFAVDENEIMRIVIQDLGIGQPLRLQIARVYDGGSDGLAVIGDNGAFRQTYNFTINGSVSYRLNYGTPNSGNLSSSGNDATWDINSITNGWEEGSYTTVAGTLVGGDNPTYYLSNTGVDYYYFASTDVTYDSSGAERGQLGKELKILATAKKIQITINGEQVECFQVPETGTYVKVSDREQRNSITNVQLLYFTKDATIYSDTNGTSTNETISAGEYKTYITTFENDTYYQLADGQFVEKAKAVVVAGKEFDKDITTVYTAPQSGQTTNLKLKNNYITLCSYTLPITLFSASGSTSTPITGVLQANAWAGSGELTDIVADVIYDGSNSMLTIIPLQYLGSDQSFNISFYTSYGYIGGLTVNVAGSASVTMEENAELNLTAGTSQSVKGLIDSVALRGENTTNYSIDSVTINSVTTTNESGEVTISGDKQKYISVANANLYSMTDKTLTLRSSTRDYTADLTITLEFDKGQTYTFNHTIEVQSNISQVGNENVVGLTEATAQTISVGDVVAGTKKGIDQEELFTIKKVNDKETGKGTTFEYSWTSNNTSVIANGDSETNGGAVTFTPNNVANAGQDVTLMVEVTMTDGELENIFYVRLQIHVVCAGKVTVTYPVIGETKLQAEYLESTKDSPAEFASAQSFFFGSKAVFAGNIRVQLADVSLDESGEQTSTPVTQPIAGEDPKPSITIIGAQNIDVMQGGTHKNASTGNNEIALSSDLKFVLGNWNDETRKNTDTGEESYVIFRIEYRGYTAEYTVYVQETVYGLSFNGATNNMTAGGDGTEVENFYVENLLSDIKIFANNRMLKYTVREGAPTGTYYLGFTPVADSGTGVNTQKYIEFVITEGDRGQTKYIELGEPYESFTGIYSRTGETGPYTPLQNNSYFDGTPTLTARVTFTYTAGENRYEVPYETFSSQIKFTAGNQSEQTLADYRISQKTNNLGNTQTLKDFIFVLGNGQIATDGANKEFANTYSYTLALDVGATTYAHDGNFPIEEIDARDEINLVETVGLIRQSTGEAYSREMFNENRTETSGNYLSFSMVDPTNPTGNDTSILLGLYNYMNNASKTTVDEDVQNAFAIAATGNYNYMAYSPVNEENGKDETAYDIRAWGQGAPIGGTIVVGKLTYNVKTEDTEDSGTFTQDFYVVFKILPAYTISVNGSAMTVEDTTYLSNITNPYEANLTDNSNMYNIDLTATSSPLVVGYEHETTASNLLNQFDKEVTTGERVNGVEYNNKLNAKNKNVFPSGTDNDNEHFWSNSSDTTYKCSRGAGTTLAPAQVHFADQKYRIKMTDVYGYYFYFYFTLKATGSAPTLQTTNITLTEGDTFDFTTSSTVISITGATGEEADQTLTMRSASHSAPTTQINNAVTIELSGFSFWFFDDYYTKPESNGRPAYLQESDSAYIGAEIDGQSGSHYEIPTEYKTYLEPSTYNNIAVSEITLLGPNGEELGCEVDLAESAGGNRLKVGVGEILEHATGSAAQLDTSGGLTYTVPTIAGSAPWEGSGSMSATMAVTFMYDPDGTSGTTDDNEEYCVVDIPITLKRKTQITSPNSYVRDGEAFTLTEYIGLQKGTSNITPTFIDDTLEVYVPANSGVTLEIYITDSEGNNRAPEEGYASITTKTYHTRQQTYYYSISQTVGRNLQAGDLIYVRATSASSATVNAGNANSPFEGYAIGYSAGVNEGNNNKTILGGGLNVWLDSNPTEDPQGPTFTAVTITRDKIGIPDTVHFTNGNYAEVQQHYVINANIPETRQINDVSYEIYSLTTGDKVYKNGENYFVKSVENENSLIEYNKEHLEDSLVGVEGEGATEMIGDETYDVFYVVKTLYKSGENYYILNNEDTLESYSADSANSTPVYVSYQYTKTYRVTWAYNNVTVNDIGRVGATVIEGSTTAYKISWGDILNKLGFSYLGEGNGTEPISANISANQFKLEVTEAGSGSARVDGNGNITTSTNFNEQDEYITLVFYRKASGADGVFGTADDVAATQPFLTFRFQIYQKSTT